jgi:hypothetical protein
MYTENVQSLHIYKIEQIFVSINFENLIFVTRTNGTVTTSGLRLTFNVEI